MTNAKNHAAPELAEGPSTTPLEGTPEHRRLLAQLYARRHSTSELVTQLAKHMGHLNGEALSFYVLSKEAATYRAPAALTRGD